MPAPPLFNYFTYASSIDTMLTTAFSALQTVSFPPTSSGLAESRFVDIALPAFVMNFENPEVDLDRVELNRFGEELTDDDSYYMPMVVRVVGYLLLPVFAEANTGVPNVKPHGATRASDRECRREDICKRGRLELRSRVNRQHEFYRRQQ